MKIRWNAISRPDWQAQTPNAAWQQSWAYGAAWQTFYGNVHRAEIVLDGETVGLAQFTARCLLRHIHVASCARGPVWLLDLDPAARSEAYRLLRRSIPLPRLSGVFITPDQGTEEGCVLSTARFRQMLTPYSTATIDLTNDADILRGRMRGKWRNRLIRAEKAQIRVASASSGAGQYDWLLDAEAEQQSQRRYRAGPTEQVTRWQAHCTGGDGVLILTATQGAERIAAMMLLRHGKGALYQIGWTNDAGRAVNAHNLLLWKSMIRLKKLGIERLDLGGLDTVENSGIARFKLGSGAKLTTLCGTWL